MKKEPSYNGLKLSGNEILAALPKKTYQRLLPDLERVSLKGGKVLYKYGDPMAYALFPDDCLISLRVAGTAIAIVGKPGFIGVSLVSGSNISIFDTVVEISGRATRMKAAIFAAEFNRGGTFQELALKYVARRFGMISQCQICNVAHPIGPRLARFLSIAADHLISADDTITGLIFSVDFASRMLNVSPQQLATPASSLQRKGVIKSGPKRIRIIDREGLKLLACGCYSVLSKS